MLRRDRIKLFQSASEQLKKSKRYFEIIQQCSHMVKFPHKELIQYYNIRGVAYVRVNKFALAIADFDKGIELLGKEDNSNADLLELFLFNRAMVHLIQKNYTQAAADLEQVSMLNQNEAYVCFYQGVVCFESGNERRALTYFLFALFLDSGLAPFNESENTENQNEVDDRKINFGVLLNCFKSYRPKSIFNKILSLPPELSLPLLNQCKDQTTFLGSICAELEEKEKEKIDFGINYKDAIRTGFAQFAPPTACAAEAREPAKLTRRELNRSQ